MNNTLIIIPAYNESKHIGKVLDALSAYDVLVINDCSTDDTVDVVKAKNKKSVTNFQHLGYGGSLQVGYRYALKHKYSYVIQMDADGQHDPCNVERILETLNSKDKPDIVLGSRFVEGAQSFKIGGFKKIAIKYLNAVINFATNKKFTDTTTGLQGLSIAAVYYYSRYNQFDFKYPDGNVLLESALAGFKIVEIPAVMHERSEGVSMHSGLKPIYYMLHMTASLLAVSKRSDIKRRYRKARDYEASIKAKPCN